MMNLYQQSVDRSNKAVQVLNAINRGKQARKTITPHGEFNNDTWMLAECEALAEEQQRLIGIVTPEGTVTYE